MCVISPDITTTIKMRENVCVIKAFTIVSWEI